MKIRKLLLTCTAIAGLSAAFAVAANADVITNDTYNKTNGTVSVKSDLTKYAGDQMTVILIPEAAYKNLQSGIADKDILYIDQDAAKADSNIFQGMGVKGGKLEPGTYYLRVGGTNIAANGILEEKVVVAADGKIYHYGNLIGDYADEFSIDTDDAAEILKLMLGDTNNVFYTAGGFDTDGVFVSDSWVWKAANLSGDFVDDFSIDTDDAAEILKLMLGDPTCVFEQHRDETTGVLDWSFKQ